MRGSQIVSPLFPKLQLRGLLRTVITYDAATSAGEMGQKPQHALPLFQKLQLRGLLHALSYLVRICDHRSTSAVETNSDLGQPRVHSLLWNTVGSCGTFFGSVARILERVSHESKESVARILDRVSNESRFFV